MNPHRPWNRIGVLLLASLLLVAATPSCLAGHCGLMLDHRAMQGEAQMTISMDCCADGCPMREPQDCETMMQGEDASDIPATPALPTFEISPAVIAADLTTDVPSGPSDLIIGHEIELDALDSSPPTHVLNSQYLI